MALPQEDGLGKKPRPWKLALGHLGRKFWNLGSWFHKVWHGKEYPGSGWDHRLGLSGLLLHGEGAEPEDSQGRGISSTRPRLGGCEEGRAPSCLGVRAMLPERQKKRLAATKQCNRCSDGMNRGGQGRSLHSGKAPLRRGYLPELYLK